MIKPDAICLSMVVITLLSVAVSAQSLHQDDFESAPDGPFDDGRCSVEVRGPKLEVDTV